MNTNTHSDSVVIKKTSNAPSLDNSMVSKVYTYSNGNTLEVITPHHRSNNLNRFQKLDKFRYVDKTTGEIHFYQKSDTKHKSPDDIQRALTNLRRLINNNFFGNLSERHIVLTYAKQVNNPKELYRDFKYFMAKLRKYYPCEYICIPEPNENNRWHIHANLKRLDNQDLNIPYHLLNELWVHGGAYITRMPEGDNLANYFCPHSNAKSDKMKKKNSRIKCYPAGMKIYSKSKNIRSPTVSKIARGELQAELENFHLVTSSTNIVESIHSDGKTIPVNAITYEKYTKV